METEQNSLFSTGFFNESRRLYDEFKNRDGDFADFFFSASNLPHSCGFLQFGAFRTLIREKEMRKKMLTK